ncbi:galactosylceramide sulfotransferase [Daphnia magna]|uniref:galactosylceramide sulfotransferase n=1 Tax=Daphnia magna TaxID=35525 RepID=UPI001E1BAB38|nr:galactosylceramide sulfotransferase [Daphnia magna]
MPTKRTKMLNKFGGQLTGRFLVRYLVVFSVASFFFVFTYHSYRNSVLEDLLVKSLVDGVRSTNQECRPTDKIAFMKTHKCASSTVENILFRHALRDKLNLALPSGGNYLSRVKLFHRNSVLHTKWGHLPVNVFTLHNRWNYPETIALMGKSTFTFTIIRDPVDQFESLYVYMGLNKFYGKDFIDFVRALKNNKYNVTDVNRRAVGGLFGRNQIAFDLGMSPAEFDNKPLIIKEWIEQLDKQFELVLIAEKMEQSLILLADFLCWPLEYVTHLELNARKPEMNVRLTQDERDSLAKWLNVDTMLYRHFSQRLDDHVTNFNERNKPDWIEEQMRILRRLNSQVVERCVIERVGNEKLKGKFLETSNSIMGYLIHQNVPECEFYAMSEPAYLNIFRERMAQLAAVTPRNHTFTKFW